MPEFHRNVAGVVAGDEEEALGDQRELAKTMVRSPFSDAVPNDDGADPSSGEIQMEVEVRAPVVLGRN